MDAIGAIGLVRNLKYGITHNIKEYDPSIPLYTNQYDESKNDVSNIHHIYNKLLRLGENMNTVTARRLAIGKTKFMEDFVEMYINESKGIFE